jgi:hypothetical protein
MATAFDGLGMGQLGSEKRFMTGSPISELTRMLPTALLGYGLLKSGAIDNLNDMFDPKKALQEKIKGAIAPNPNAGVINDGTKGYKPSDYYEAEPIANSNQGAAAMLPPPAVAQPVAPTSVAKPVPAQGNVPEINADDLVKEIIPSFKSSQNTLTPRDASQDIGMLQIASTPAAPPSPMNLPQYGQNGGGSALVDLTKLFFA